MPTSLHGFKNHFHEQVLGFLWRQWSALGVAGHARADDNRMIDPEALLMITTSFARHEPRLFDEVLDWLSQEGGTINLQRLKNLQNAYSFGQGSVLAAMAAFVGRRPSQVKWRSLAKEMAMPAGAGTGPRKEKPSGRKKGAACSIPATPEPLFFGVPVMGEPDELFLDFGWLRDAPQPRGLSTAPDPHLPSNFIFKLRALFGLQARAEIMACLLGSEAVHPAQIAALTGYFPRTVQLALNEMARSGHLLSARDGREKYFHLRKEEWRFLVKSPEGHFPRWLNWSPIFAALDAVARKFDRPGFDSAPAALRAMELRQVFDRMSPALRSSGLHRQFQTTPDLAGQEFVDTLMGDLVRFLD